MEFYGLKFFVLVYLIFVVGDIRIFGYLFFLEILFELGVCDFEKFEGF